MTTINYLSSYDKKISISLTLLYIIRMLGLFIVLPIFSFYEKEFSQVTPFLLGFAFGAYALTQIVFQPIFGILSDRYGRKKIIIIGLFLFFIGSLIIAYASSIYGVILGRFIQGSGAISAVVLAFVTDLIREEIRVKVMAMIGISIGITFGVSMFLGTYLYDHFNMKAVFITCALLGLIGIIITQFLLPNDQRMIKEIDTSSEKENWLSLFKSAMNHHKLWRLYWGAFSLHLILSMFFMTVPQTLIQSKLLINGHWKVYVPCFFLSILVMGKLLSISRKQKKTIPIFKMAIYCLMIAFLSLYFFNSLSAVIISMILFFIGFNTMEVLQPSLMAENSPATIRGVSMGIFSSTQFFGASLGGILGNMIRHIELNWVYLACFLVSLLWVIITYSQHEQER